MEGLEGSMQEVATALSGLGVKMERLAEITLATQQTGLATAASVEVRVLYHWIVPPRCWHRPRCSTDFRCRNRSVATGRV